MEDRRIALLEGRVETLERGLEGVLRELELPPPEAVRVERRPPPRVSPTPRPVSSDRPPVAAPRPAPRPVRPAPAAKPAPRSVNLEDLLGGRVLAWVGGAAVLVGVIFFFALAISN